MASCPHYDSDTEHHLTDFEAGMRHIPVDDDALDRMAAAESRPRKRKNWVKGKFDQSEDTGLESEPDEGRFSPSAFVESDTTGGVMRFSNGALGVNDPEEDAEKWEPAPIVDLDAASLSESEPEPEKGYCFMCDCSQNAREMESNPRFQKLKELWDNNCGIVDPLRNAKLCFDYYEKNLRQRTKDKAYCSPTMFHTHFTIHSPTIITMMEDSLRVLNAAMATLRDGCLVEQEKRTKRRRLDLKNTKMYLDLFEKRKALMQEIHGRRPTHIA